MRAKMKKRKVDYYLGKGFKARLFFGAVLLALIAFVPDAWAVQIKNVQRGKANFDNWDVSVSVNITAVDMSKTIILLYPTGGNQTNDQHYFFTAQFESNSMFQINRAGAAGSSGTSAASAGVIWEVIEFVDGVNVQRGISSMGQDITQKKIIIY